MKATIVITLQIDGDSATAMEAVDQALDAGHLQDQINQYHEDHDDVDPLLVTSAVATFVPEEA